MYSRSPSSSELLVVMLALKEYLMAVLFFGPEGKRRINCRAKNDSGERFQSSELSHTPYHIVTAILC